MVILVNLVVHVLTPISIPRSGMAEEIQPRSRVDAPAVHAVWRRLGHHRLALAGGAIVLVVATLAVALPVVIATDPTALDVQATLTSPSRRHWFGTERLRA